MTAPTWGRFLFRSVVHGIDRPRSG